MITREGKDPIIFFGMQLFLLLLLCATGGVVEIPSYIITWYTMDRWGRRWILCLTMLLGGMACVSCMFVPEGEQMFCVQYLS
jgi:hypothetical protein